MITLNDQQSDAYDRFRQGKNLFITGSGGTGKSALVRYIKRKHPLVAVTALTGCAAVLLECNAMTLHSWAGIGLGKDPIPKLVQKIKKARKYWMRWTCTRTLIIDEISMMSSELFEVIDQIGRQIRGVEKPFGGLQMLFVGDFFQLPPIHLDGELRFCFESPVWQACVDRTIQLTEIIRQEDKTFQKILDKVRRGECDEEVATTLQGRVGLNATNDLDIKPTVLFSHNLQAQRINGIELRCLRAPVVTFAAETRHVTIKTLSPRQIEAVTRNLDRNSNYDASLKLSEGAQVMLLANLSTECGLVNGSRGIIKSINATEKLVDVKFLNGVESSVGVHAWKYEDDDGNEIHRIQLPLKLAWASSIHKSQGSTLDYAEMDIGNSIFDFGQAYVALSRVRNLEGLFLLDFEPRRIMAHPKVIKFYSDLESSTPP